MTSLVLTAILSFAGDQPPACEEWQRHMLGARSAWQYGGAIHERRVSVAEKECAAGSAGCCLLAGLVNRDRLSPPADYSKAYELLSRGCGLGSAEACIEFAGPSNTDNVATTRTKGILRSLARHVLLDDCRRGAVEACGAWLRSRDASSEEVPTASDIGRIVADQCVDGNNQACDILFQQDAIAEAEVFRATIESACDRGYGPACGRRALALLASSQDRMTTHKALILLDLACSRKDADTCYVLGLAYDGRPPESFTRLSLSPNQGEATHYFEAACALEQVAGCVEAARIVLSSQRPDAESRAKNLSQRACGLGAIDSCPK